MIYTAHEGTQATKPLGVEVGITTVYLRKNIRQETKADSQNGETINVWVYDEAALSHEEFQLWASENNLTGLEEASKNITDTQLALCEVYEMIATLS